jgi:predicted permease
MSIPLLRGRDFSPHDVADGPHVAVVNEAAAAIFWPAGDPIGKRIHFVGDAKPAEIVGVARNANYQAIGEAPQALVYLPFEQYYSPVSVVYLRSAGPEVAAANVRRALQSLDHNLYFQSEALIRTMRDELWAQRLSAGLLGVFGILALSLAVVGIYGVVSYSMTQRVREIGVRMALGATPSSVQLMLVREGLGLVTVGVCLGTAIALAGSRVVRSMLFTIGPYDPLTFCLVPVILTFATVAACWLPARRATRIDPSVALRHE